jgi:hypothetical protein
MLTKLRPINEKAEKKTFFQAYKCDKVYNPQFEYVENTYCTTVRRSFDDVFYTDLYAERAEAILEETMRQYGTAASYKAMVWGEVISPEDAMARAEEYARINNIQTNIEFGKSLVTTMGKDSLNLVKKPGYYRDIRLDSLLDHELSVHYIRSKNHKLLDSETRSAISESRKAWLNEQLTKAGRKVCAGLRRLLEQHVITMDEEGLASVVTHAVYNHCYLLFQPALSNYIVHLAKTASFYNCVKTIMTRHYATDLEDAWTQVMRAKRSQQNTALPGGFCKDILPFIGAIKLLENVHKVELPLIFVGKFRFEEYCSHEELIRAQFQRDVCQIPHFVQYGRHDAYMQQLLRMREANLTGEGQEGKEEEDCKEEGR